ncbi:uncharacterized protein [Dermacentor albipictus]|uniref:uncharacterized protein isoform X2 n=1 Tax=Dermacentor albipictus TaxID=60249 RepID=UPI0038FCE6D3
MMGHPNRLHFFATQFLVLSWILKLTPFSEQPTWIPLPADEDAPHCHGELRRTYLYGTSECASQITPLLSLRCHWLTPWLPGTLSSIDSAIFPRIPDIKPRQTIATLSGLGGTSMMGHPNRLHFFATQFLVLSWILKLTPFSEQPTWIPLPADEDAPHCHGELRRTYLYGTSECASQITPLLSLRCHWLTPWLPGTLSSIDSAIFPRIPDIKPRQTIATLSGLGGTSMMGHPNRLHFFATQFLVLSWILKLTPCSEQPTWIPLPVDEDAPHCHGELRRTYLYGTSECASQITPLLSLRCHWLTPWLPGTLSSIDSAIFPRIPDIKPRQTIATLSGLGGTSMMGHPNRLHFFATQFLVLSWILKLTPCSEQPTWIPLPADEDAPHCHGELRRTYLYGTSECASQITPLLSLRCHWLTPWLPGTLSSIDSAIFPRIPDIKPRQTIATLSGLGGTSMMGHPNRLHFFATQNAALEGADGSLRSRSRGLIAIHRSRLS